MMFSTSVVAKVGMKPLALLNLLLINRFNPKFNTRRMYTGQEERMGLVHISVGVRKSLLLCCNRAIIEDDNENQGANQ